MGNLFGCVHNNKGKTDAYIPLQSEQVRGRHLIRHYKAARDQRKKKGAEKMYQTTEVENLPMRAKNGERVKQLLAFLQSGKQTVKLEGIAPEDVWKVYCGLYNASKRKACGNKVRVIKRENVVYLYRMG